MARRFRTSGYRCVNCGRGSLVRSNFRLASNGEAFCRNTESCADHAKEFNINRDLKGRPLAQQIEILWVSGPTRHNARMIAERLGVPESKVYEFTGELK